MDPQVERVLTFWFGGSQSVNYKTKWFPSGSKDLQHEADVLVLSQFGELFQRAINHELDHWMSEPKSHLALIIVLDQFSRHIFRLEGLGPDHASRKGADLQALAAAEAFTSRSDWEKVLTTAEFVFALMPFRHSATIPRLTSVMASIEGREAAAAEDAELLGKFRKQSTRRLQHLQDRAKVHSGFKSTSLCFTLCYPAVGNFYRRNFGKACVCRR
jgi:uncharacterized protein (DUF924 family)